MRKKKWRKEYTTIFILAMCGGLAFTGGLIFENIFIFILGIFLMIIGYEEENYIFTMEELKKIKRKIK